MEREYIVDICGYKVHLPVLEIAKGLSIAFLNLHGAQALTEHCAKNIVKLIPGAEVILTAESKGLQLAHCVARELGQEYYAVARKTKKLYMQDGVEAWVKSMTTKDEQKLYLSSLDVELIRGKKVAIIDDVISTGGSLSGLEKLVALAGGKVVYKAFVLAEGPAADRKDVKYLAKIPVFTS